MKLSQIPVPALRVHPLVATAWQLPEDHSDFVQIVESVREHGILEPLKVTRKGEVVDGRHRLRAAKLLDLESLPCIEIPGEEAASVALSTLVARRHLVTRGQLAYGAWPLFQEAYREVLIRRGRDEAGRLQAQPFTVQSFALSIGISRDLLDQASRLHQLFAENGALRTEWEPRIMDPVSPIGLGAALAGIAGQAASRGVTPARNSALRKWECAWHNLKRPAAAWDGWTAEERDYASATVQAVVTALPDPLLDVLRDALRTARRQRNGGAE